MSKAGIKRFLDDAAGYCKNAKGAVHFADEPAFRAYIRAARTMLDKAEQAFNKEWEKREGKNQAED